MLDQIMLMGNRFVVVGDFNVPGDVAGQLDPHAIDVLTQYGLRQHVTGPTHISGNTLDLILSRDQQISEQLTVQSVCFSDHHLLTCRLGVPLPQPVTTTYTYRSLRRIDTAAFSADILQSRLYGELELELDADGYADLFDAEVKRRSNESWTFMRRCGHFVVIVVSMTAATYQTRRAMPSSSVGDLNVGTAEPVYNQTRRLVQLHVRAS